MAYLLTQLAQQAAQIYPDHPAVVHEDSSLTYAELETESNQVAQQLLALGVQHGDRVGVFFPKSPRKVIALLGIMKAGAAYVPLDPNMPTRRVAYILQDCQIQCLITNVGQWQKVQKVAKNDTPLPAMQLIFTDDEVASNLQLSEKYITWPKLRQRDAIPLHIPALIESDLAYILYTSGSTGNPKGVMISHRAALTFVDWAHETFGISHEDRLSSHAPFHFDLSIFDLYVAFKAGATVHLLPPMLSVFPLALAQYIATQKLTVWYSVPSILIKLVQHGELATHDFSALRCVLFAGEVFPVKYLRQLMAQIPYASYHNLYGPTETNVCTWYTVPPLDSDRTEPISIGKGCANSEILVFNEQNELVLPGEVGELCVRGPGLMRGYWGLPERTKQSLTPCVVHEHLGPEPIYRTGDLVRAETEGNYTYLGRRDNQIKSRGYRIELGDIETALYHHPNIAEVAVLAVPDEEISHRLVGVIVSQEGAELTIPQLKTFISTQLPKYMTPDAFHFVAQLPYTSTGKVDRRALLAVLDYAKKAEVAKE